MHVILGQKMCRSEQIDLSCSQSTRCASLKHSDMTQKFLV